MTDQSCVLAHHKDPDRPRRALDGLYVCGGHRQQLADRLEELGAGGDALAERLITTNGGREMVTGSHSVGLCLDERVMESRSDIYWKLAGWAKRVASDRGLHLPADRCPAIAAFLIRHLDWCCARDWIGEYHAEIMDVSGTAKALLYPSGRRRRPVGQCVERTWCDVATRTEQRCTGTLYAVIGPTDDLLPAKLECDTCGVEVPATRWEAFRRRYRATEHVA